MTNSSLAFLALSFLSSAMMGFLVILPVLLIYYLFMKRVRLFGKVYKQYKKMLKKRHIELEKIAKTEEQDEFSVW